MPIQIQIERANWEMKDFEGSGIVNLHLFIANNSFKKKSDVTLLYHCLIVADFSMDRWPNCIVREPQ